jgi:hypothetical protein
MFSFALVRSSPLFQKEVPVNISVLVLIKWHPYYSLGYNRVNYMLDFTKAFSHILMITFVESFHINVSITSALNVLDLLT